MVESSKKLPINFSDVSVVMASLNEELAVSSVIDEIYKVTNKEAEIVIVDSSNDNTREIAQNKGVKVIKQNRQGYGIALQKAINSASGELIITTDCDYSYPMDKIPTMIATLYQGYDFVGGYRLRGLNTPNMKKLHIIGNYFFSFLITILFGKRIRDSLSGMRVFRKTTYQKFNWEENYAFSAELLFKPIMQGMKVKEIPISYRKRIGNAKLKSFTHGFEIFISIIKYRKVQFLLIFMVLTILPMYFFTLILF